MGRDVGGLFGGSAITVAEVLGLRQIWADLEGDAIPDDAVVISDHQGYQCMFMSAAEGDDPPVWHLMEGHLPSIVASTLADLLEADDASDVLSPRDRERHRRATLAGRRRAYEPEMCPDCGGELAFGGQIEFSLGLPDSGRERTVATCRSCGHDFWKWADDLEAPLRHT